ncbi:hypothetical protein Ciccas_008917 [Cichlidogyrus casuarinus]|uniref:FERM domain-containing protein n=1 Tax=Cichlidogyrus casuarinus TaxID=1844966 RepID=A0ABD2PYZ2_9PLAT
MLKISRHSSYFGLYYLLDDATKEWVNLNLPLVPQLKKSVITDNFSVNSDFATNLKEEKKPNALNFLSKSKSKSSKKRFMLYFAVKYFPTDPTSISDGATRYLLFLQIRTDLLSGRLQVDEETKTHTYCFYSIVPRGISIESTVVPLIFFKWNEIVAFDRKNTKIILKAKIDNNDFEYKFDAGRKNLAKSIVNLSQDHLFYRRVNREVPPLQPTSSVLPPHPYSIITEPDWNSNKTITVRSFETDASEQSHMSVRTDPLGAFRERQLMHKELDMRARRSCRPPVEARPRDYGMHKPTIPPRSRSRENYERRYSYEPVSGRKVIPQQAPKSIYLSTAEPAAMSQSVHFKIPENDDSTESELEQSGEFSGGAKSDFLAYRRSFHHRVKRSNAFPDYMALPMTRSYVAPRPRILNPKPHKEEVRFVLDPPCAAAYSSEDSGHGDSTRVRLDEDYMALELEDIKSSPSKETITQDPNNNNLVV